MREAIVRIRDEGGEALGMAEFRSVVGDAGVRDVAVLSCDGAGGVVRIEVDRAIEGDRLSGMDEVQWWEQVADTSDGATYVLGFDADHGPTTCPELVLCGARAVDDGAFTLNLAGPEAAVVETVEAYDRAGTSVSLEALRDYAPDEGPGDALTERQREVARAALEAGYFDVPRAASTDDLADELDLDPSTVSEHLQRAERNLFAAVLPGTSH